MKIKRCAKCGKKADVCLGDIGLCFQHYDEFNLWLAPNKGEEKDERTANLFRRCPET